jgi:hypothetical protein
MLGSSTTNSCGATIFHDSQGQLQGVEWWPGAGSNR